MANLKIGILYLGLHNQMQKKYGVNAIIPRKFFDEKLGRFNHLHKKLRAVVLVEMEEKKLIEKIDRDNIRILPCEIDLERDMNKLCHIAGLF